MNINNVFLHLSLGVSRWPERTFDTVEARTMDSWLRRVMNDCTYLALFTACFVSEFSRVWSEHSCSDQPRQGFGSGRESSARAHVTAVQNARAVRQSERIIPLQRDIVLLQSFRHSAARAVHLPHSKGFDLACSLRIPVKDYISPCTRVQARTADTTRDGRQAQKWGPELVRRSRQPASITSSAHSSSPLHHLLILL